MSFDAPGVRDFDNVASLNSAYLGLLGSERALGRGLLACPPTLQKRLSGLTRAEARRLAETPFLLFSFRERDDRYWDAVLDRPTEPRLFRSSGSEPVDTLIAAALGYVWQLANRNPYSLRLVCGATLYWCERIADLTFYGLLDAVRNSGDVPLLRHAHVESLWRKLLDDGTHSNGRIRRAAHLSALQFVLTDAGLSHAPVAWKLAARGADAPELRVAEAGDRPKS